MKRKETPGAQREKLLLALVEGLTPEQAADRVGISRVTAWRWRRGRKFKARLERARGELFRAGLDRVVAGVAEAVDALRRNLTCGNPQAENAAAGKLLDAALKYREQLDLAGRLEAVESRLDLTQEAEPCGSTPG